MIADIIEALILHCAWILFISGFILHLSNFMENTNLVIDAIVVNSFVHLIFMPITDFFFFFTSFDRQRKGMWSAYRSRLLICHSLSALYKHSLTICMG